MGLRVAFLLSLFGFIEAILITPDHNNYFTTSSGYFSAAVSSQYNKFAAHQSVGTQSQSEGLFTPADEAEQAAYERQVARTHRVALANRVNNTDVAYREAYNDALADMKAKPIIEMNDPKSNSYQHYNLEIEQSDPFSHGSQYSHNKIKTFVGDDRQMNSFGNNGARRTYGYAPTPEDELNFFIHMQNQRHNNPENLGLKLIPAPYSSSRFFRSAKPSGFKQF